VFETTPFFITYGARQNIYKGFQRANVLFRDARTMKRHGRGHDPNGIDGTEKAELVVECPACPHPGKNLPPDWEKAGPEDGYATQLESLPAFSLTYSYSFHF
jgi:hypothetical protein